MIVAARDAEATLPETLESLLRQSLASWQAIVVDDGSRDDTAGIVRRLAERDARFILLRTRGLGAAAARNRGITAATAPWLLFLDADDLLTPHALERLLDRAHAAPAADVVHGRWRYVLPNGRELPLGPRPPADLFAALGRWNPLPIHSCLHRRSLVVAQHGFDESFPTCEDWDMLQRLARAGARFAPLEEPVALYGVRPDTKLSSVARVMRYAAMVIDRAHGPDPRVVSPDPRYAAGLDPAGAAGAKLATAAWLAALGLGAGHAPHDVLDVIEGVTDPGLDPSVVGDSIADALPRGAVRPPADWPELWPEALGPVRALLGRLERMSGSRALAARAERELERGALRRIRPEALTALGSSAAATVELTRPLADLAPPGGVGRLLLFFRYDGAAVGSAELPVCDGRVVAAVVADAAAANCAWEILGRFFGATLYPALLASAQAREARALPGAVETGAELHERAGWQLFVQELWDDRAAGERAFYEYEAPGGLARRLGAVARRLVTPRRLVLDLPGPLPRARGPLELEVRVGGAPIGSVPVPTAGAVSRAELRARVSAATGFDLCSAVVREALVGRPAGAGSLTDRLRRGEARREEGLDGLVLARRCPAEFNSSVTRRASLPATAAPELRRMARALGEHVIEPRSAAPARVDYLPARLRRGAGRAGRAGPRPEWEREAAPDDVETTARLPILVYHRVAPRGAAAKARWRVTPEAFDEQLAWLSEAGYAPAGVEEWREALSARQRLGGRRVCITFDDAYADFAEHAWPALRRHGFGAHLFVVTGLAGSVNRWDVEGRERLPLLGWSELEQLHRDGVSIGSHGANHVALGTLSPAEITRELALSRAELGERLGLDARLLAYPYGDHDGAVEHLAGACGYRVGLTCDNWRSGPGDRPLALPRLEVTGSDDAASLARKLALPA